MLRRASKSFRPRKITTSIAILGHMIGAPTRHDNCTTRPGSLFSPHWCEKAAEKGVSMEFGGRYLLAAPRAAVWAALNDSQMLKAAIPGCRSIGWTGDDSLELEIQVNLGVLHPVFAGDLRLSDIVPGRALYALRQGAGRAARAGARIGGMWSSATKPGEPASISSPRRRLRPSHAAGAGAHRQQRAAGDRRLLRTFRRRMGAPITVPRSSLTRAPSGF